MDLKKKKESDDSKERKLWRNRLRHCFYSICLLWTQDVNFAIGVAIFAVGYYPSWNDVVEIWSGLEADAEQMDRERARCIERQFHSCYDGLEATVALENERVNEIHQRNNWLVTYAEEDQEKRENALGEILTYLHEEVSAGNPLPFASHNSSTCSQEERDYLSSLIGGDFQNAISNTDTIISDFQDDAKERVDRLANYAKDRISYDREYLYNKTSFAFNKLDGLGNLTGFVLDDVFRNLEADLLAPFTCVGLAPSDPCLFKTLRDIVVAVVETGNAQTEYLTNQLTEAYKAIAAMGSRIDYDNELFVQADAFLNFIHSLFPNINVFSLARNFGLDIDLWTSLSPGISYFPGSISIPNFEKLSVGPFIDQFEYDMIRTIERLVNQARIDFIHSLGMSLSAYALDLRGILGLEDYNPPQYSAPGNSITDPQDEIARHNEASQAFGNDVRKSLDSIPMSDRRGSGDVQVPDQEFNPGNVTSDVRQAIVPQLDFGRLDFLLPFWPVLLFLFTYRKKLVNALNLANSVRKIKNYWDKSSISPPLVDDRDHIESSTEQESRVSLKRKLLSWLITNLQVGFWHFWIILFLALVASVIYPPYLKHYRKNCVETANGTDLAKFFVAPYLFKQATDAGNTAVIVNTPAFDLRRYQQCSSNYAESARSLHEDQLDLAFLAIKRNRTETEFDRLSRCVDIQDTNIGDQRFPSKEYTLMNATFQCEDLQVCNVDCGGETIATEINQRAIQSMCLIEWHFNGRIWNFSLAFVIIIVFWVSRNNIEAGLKKIYWESLRGGSPDVILSLHKLDVEDLLNGTKEKVDAAVRGFVRSGYLQVLFGILVNIVWIVAWVWAEKHSNLRPEWYV